VSRNDYDMPVFCNVREVIARRPHICGECGRIVERGHRYERAAGKWDHGLATHHTCADCVAWRDGFIDARRAVCGMDDRWYFGEVWADIREYCREFLGYDA